ncbi:MAG: shikimate kinase AroL [Desulfobacteraceae bacterium]|jgi:shikimate kinase|nr:shikimate kinase AroL [Desulfobacteraceae bacterium]
MLTRTMNLFLIGYRCTGKTSVGEVLAQQLGWRFVDTDRMVVDTGGVSIARMVADHGWPFFREQERQALVSVSTGHRQVVATGGGIILDERNVSAMKQSGRIVWLTADERTILTRMRGDSATSESRPSLTRQGLTAEIAAVLAERRPLYEKAADRIIATDRRTVAVICERILDAIGLQKEASGHRPAAR